MTTEKTPSQQEWTKAQARDAPKAKRCGYCGVDGHNIRTCPAYFKASK